MKRLIAVFLMLFVLCGCSSNSALDSAMKLREKLLNGNGCEFQAIITADYGDKLYSFSVACKADTAGRVDFTVLKPESIQGISGYISADGGNLTFDDEVLSFAMIADGQITPVSAPWLFIRTLQGGYIKGCATTEEGMHLQIDDSYLEDAMQVDVFTDSSIIPTRTEFLWRGRRILSMDIECFTFA